ncbi:hypothetical protein HDU96_006547 [Phlyctochytrium bullatum]|nr:hypothetical protein HDU96_006547 [Phlyctochytrium bullatum]
MKPERDGKAKHIKARSPPDFDKEPVFVKPTAATILREDALVRRIRKEDMQVLREVELSLHDATEFNQWQEEIRQKNEEERRFELEKRRLEIQLLHEEAVEAKIEKIKEKQEIVKEVKEESQALKEIASLHRRQVEEENKKKIEDIHEIQEGVVKAKLKVATENQRKAADVSMENQILKEKAQREAEEDRLRKIELIQQIRLLEKSVLPVGSVVKSIDPTETSGLGLLGEMSILEVTAFSFSQLKALSFRNDSR